MEIFLKVTTLKTFSDCQRHMGRSFCDRLIMRLTILSASLTGTEAVIRGTIYV